MGSLTLVWGKVNSEFKPVKLHLKIIELILFTNPSARAGYDTRSIFKRSLTGLSSEFSFSLTSCLNKAEEPIIPYYLPIAGGRITGFIPFPRVLVLCEMQLVSARIWTRIAVSISYDDNHYNNWTYVASCLCRGVDQQIHTYIKSNILSCFSLYQWGLEQADFISWRELRTIAPPINGTALNSFRWGRSISGACVSVDTSFHCHYSQVNSDRK